MAELAAVPQQGEPPALSPELRQQGWSIKQSSEGDWYYVLTGPNGGRFETTSVRPSRGWPAAQLLGRDQADELYEEAVVVAVAACAANTAGQTCYICYGEGDEEGLVRMCACRGAEGFAHVSCLARGAQAAVERDADTGWARWYACGLCEQDYHGVVRCALGWACWKTYVDRPEMDEVRCFAMTQLGNGLSAADHDEDALSVNEAELSTLRRIGAPEEAILVVRSNLACTYQSLERLEEALSMQRDVYSGRLKLHGENNVETIREALNYASSLISLERFQEAKSLLRKTMPVARRVLGEGNDATLKMRWSYARALYENPGATLDDIREAVMTLEETTRIARQVLGGAHPLTVDIEYQLRDAELRAALRACETPDDETVDVPAQEDDTESPTPVAAPMPAEATVAPRPPPPLPRRVTSIDCCW